MTTFDRALQAALNNPDVIVEDSHGGSHRDLEAGYKRQRRAQRVTVDGITFDSKNEAERHAKLALWQRQGIITELVLKPKFVLQPAFRTLAGRRVAAITWTADWAYRQLQPPHLEVIEDFKGYSYRSFRVKLPLILYVLREKHVFVNQDLGGWYDPSQS